MPLMSMHRCSLSIRFDFAAQEQLNAEPLARVGEGCGGACEAITAVEFTSLIFLYACGARVLYVCGARALYAGCERDKC